MTPHIVSPQQSIDEQTLAAEPDGCPYCPAEQSQQALTRHLRDGAFDRTDYTCQVCEVEYPIWS